MSNMEEKKNYNVADMNIEENGKPHIGEQDHAQAQEIDENTPANVIDNNKNQDVQFEPQPVHPVDRDTERPVAEKEEVDR